MHDVTGTEDKSSGMNEAMTLTLYNSKALRKRKKTPRV